jgi:hypothetical protein
MNVVTTKITTGDTGSYMLFRSPAESRSDSADGMNCVTGSSIRVYNLSAPRIEKLGFEGREKGERDTDQTVLV